MKKLIKIFLVLLLIYGCRHVKPDDGIGSNPPVFLKGISYDYCALNPSKDYKPFIDMLNSYNINMLRTFAYCGWSEDFFPWTGYMGNLKPEYVNRLKEFVSYANSKKIWVILSLFQDNAGGGTENITSRDKGELATYILKIVEVIKDKGVIFEAINENPDSDFQSWVLSELNKYGVRRSTYEVSLGADYDTHHTNDKNWTGQAGWSKYIHSTDTPKLIYLSDDDLIRISEQAKEKGGHIEFLVFWGRDSQELKTPQDITNEYGKVLEKLKGM